LDLQFPLSGGTYYIAHGGTGGLLNHHWTSKSQRYALDIVRLNVVGMRAAGIYPMRLDKYAIFGDVVSSPCAGVVTASGGDLKDLAPAEMDEGKVAGNHVVIRCDNSDAYVGLAHLKEGSVRVRVGDRVCVGQELARVGNSGHTTEPHLHMHAKRGGDPLSLLDGEGVPLRFRGRWLIRNSLVFGEVAWRQPA
jgi:Peptidase family M23